MKPEKKTNKQKTNTITTQVYQSRFSSWKPSNKARIARDFSTLFDESSKVKWVSLFWKKKPDFLWLTSSATRDHGEKSQKQLPSVPVKAGWITFCPRSVWNQNFIFATHKHNLFPMHLKNHLKTSNLSADNLKNPRPRWVDTWARDAGSWYCPADILF